LEGDNSQDLYALVSGKLDILKGSQKITEVSEEGAIFGEMSFLLQEARTASVKAATDAEVIRIPREEVSEFLAKFPEVVKAFAGILAKRLDETSRLAFGLQEFCNQLPDAVILADKEGKILSFNASAERLYGRESNEMHQRPAEEIYDRPEEYRAFIEDVISQYSVQEKTLRVKHPHKGTRYISTSTTVLYDAQHNFQGVLSLGRDVTDMQALERRYRRARRWVIPLLILVLLMMGGVFWGYPHFYKEYGIMDSQRTKLRDELAVDYRLLSSMIVNPFQAKDRARMNEALRRFFAVKEDVTTPYTGVVVLNNEKKVFDAYALTPGEKADDIIGSSYTGVKFRGDEASPHRVLTVYRTDRDHPMGHKEIEVAFEVFKGQKRLGWLIFRLNAQLMRDKYHVDEATLEAFRFKDFVSSDEEKKQ
jgi:PAS domain S-box-containing protein